MGWIVRSDVGVMFDVQARDVMSALVRSDGLGDVYKL